MLRPNLSLLLIFQKYYYHEQILLPQLWIGAIVVMDNLPVHYAEKARVLIESVGAKVKFLPPYSPDLSPIELCWSKLKEILRSAPIS